MKKIFVIAFLAFGFVASSALAQSGNIAISISPAGATLNTGGTQQFTAQVTDNGRAITLPLRWALRGVRTNPPQSWGTLSKSGFYTAPQAVPPGGSVTVAVYALGQWGNPLAQATAQVTVGGGAASPSPSPAGMQALFARLDEYPDDLAWHQNTLWGVNLVRADSVTKVNIAAAMNAIARGQTRPLALRNYIAKTYTSILLRDGRQIGLAGPTGLTSDGTYLWLATYGDKRIWQVNPGPNQLVEIKSFSYAPGGGPRGLAWEARNKRLWVADDVHGRVYALNPQNGSALSWFASPSSSGQPTGLAFDGTNLRLATYHDAKYWTLSLSGAVVRSGPAFGRNPVGLAWGQGRLWGDDDGVDEIHD